MIRKKLVSRSEFDKYTCIIVVTTSAAVTLEIISGPEKSVFLTWSMRLNQNGSFSRQMQAVDIISQSFISLLFELLEL